MAWEDRARRVPQGYQPAPEDPLDCFGPIPELPPAVPGPGRWSAPAPGGDPGDRMWVRVSAARGPRRGAALLVPPWKIPSPRLLAGWIRLLARAGWETWLLTPPHHLERTAPGSRRGEAFASADLRLLRRSVEQAVREIRACARLASAAGEVGVVGLSLGALPAALAATGPEPLAFAALVAPPDLAEVLTATPIGRRYRALAQRAGSPIPAPEAVGPSLRPLDPAARPPTARRLCLAAGRHDAIAPPAGAERLARAWGEAPRLYRRGHLTLLFACRALRRDLSSFLAGA